MSAQITDKRTPFPQKTLACGFGLEDWWVKPKHGQMTRGSEKVELEPKAMAVLLCLAEHDGQPVSREIIMDTVWPGVFVSEEALEPVYFPIEKSL